MSQQGQQVHVSPQVVTTEAVTAPAEDFGRLMAQPVRSVSVFTSIEAFETAQRMAKMLAASSMVPKQYQTRAETVKDEAMSNCMVALNLANRTGADVFMIMQNLYVVHGRPGWSAVFLIASANASGRFTPLRWEWKGKPGSDDYGARVVAKDASGELCEGSWVTMKLVKAEGWWDRKSRDGGPASKWPTMTEQMFMYRSAAFWVRTYCPEVSVGMHTVDEIIDSPDPIATAFTPAQAAKEALEAAGEPIPAAKPAAKPEPAKEAAKTKPKPAETKPAAKPEPKVEPKPEAKPEPTPSVAETSKTDRAPAPEPEQKQPAMFPKEEIDGPDWMQAIRNSSTIAELDENSSDAVTTLGIEYEEVEPIYNTRKKQILDAAKG